MNLSLYSAATGMNAQQLNLNTIANNLANVNTSGFKRSKIEFQDMLYQRTRAAGAEAGGGKVLPTGIEIGNGSRVSATARVFTQGQLTESGERFDMAIRGDGFFEVQRTDGTVAYTRDGSFKVNGNGEIVTSNGLQVLSGFEAVPSGTTDVTISEGGEVTYTTPGGDQTFRLTLTRFANPAGLRSVGGNLFEESSASGAPETGQPGEEGFGTIHQYNLEASNVNMVEEMVNLIIAQRAYEVSSKAIQASEEMLEKVTQLKR